MTDIFSPSEYRFPTELRFVRLHDAVRLVDDEYEFYIQLQRGGDVVLVTLRKFGPDIRSDEPNEIIGMPYTCVGRNEVETAIDNAYRGLEYARNN